jgi:hypothetical protein
MRECSRQSDPYARRVRCTVAAVLLAVSVSAATPNAAATVDSGERDVALASALERIAELPADSAIDDRSTAIEQHWRLLQQQMRALRREISRGGTACAQWVLMDPGPVGRGSADAASGSTQVVDCPMMNHGWQTASARGWDPPAGGDAAAYLRAMRGPGSPAATTAVTDGSAVTAGDRASLLARYEANYRRMQTARGLGWMWSPASAEGLPDPDSAGAALLRRYCTQCHAAPPATLHDARGWSAVIGRMRVHAIDAERGSTPDFEMPEPAELHVIEGYLRAHGAAAGSE